MIQTLKSGHFSRFKLNTLDELGKGLMNAKWRRSVSYFDSA